MKLKNQSKKCELKRLHVNCKRSLSVLSISMLVLMMTACSNSTHLLPAVPSNLLQPCDKLQQLSGNTGKAVMLWSIDTVAKYNDCASKVDALIEINKPSK